MGTFLKSKRDKDMVAFNRYKYNFASKNSSTHQVRWRCVKRSCYAKLYTSDCGGVVNAENVLKTDRLRHNHTPCSDTEMNRQIVSNSCKRKASKNLRVQPRKIILKELSRNEKLADVLTSNDVNLIRTSIYRNRNKNLPITPTNFNTAEANKVSDTSKNELHATKLGNVK